MQVMGEKTWRYLEGVKEKTSSTDRVRFTKNFLHGLPLQVLRDTWERLQAF